MEYTTKMEIHLDSLCGRHVAIVIILLSAGSVAMFQNTCAMESFLCLSDRIVKCKPGKCIRIENGFSEDLTPLCRPICKPLEITTVQANITVEANMTDVTVEGNGNGTTWEETHANETTIPALSNRTSTTMKPIPMLNSSYCTRNYFCQNGGNCSSLYLSEKIPHPKCDCPPNWVGTFCDEECALECFNNGFCHNINGTQVCNCPFGYAHPDCQFLVSTLAPAANKQQSDWYIPVLACFAVLVIVLLGYFLLLKLRGKSILVTKIFHLLQPYEDDDEKLFDAFISFRSTKKDYSQSDDEKFVLHLLQPRLENEFQYSVCVHYRDFQPGETIANNIMWAVENSRRTILILSPLYVESEWARLEYQKAQQEMMQLRHKIIPIIYEDISNTYIEDPNLKHILSSVTYINYPPVSDKKASDKFWQMLRLALPKKRTTDVEMRKTTSTASSETATSTLPTSRDSWHISEVDTTDIRADFPVAMQNGEPLNDKGFTNLYDSNTRCPLRRNDSIHEGQC